MQLLTLISTDEGVTVTGGLDIAVSAFAIPKSTILLPAV